MTTTLTKKPTTDEMLKVAVEMRKHQKAFFATRDSMELRKSRELEKQFDEMLVAYRGGNLLINIIGDDQKQTTLEL